MKICIFWGGRHTLPKACDQNTWYSFYNSGWKYGFESLGHSIDYFAWDDNDNHPGYDLYIYAPGFLTTATFHKNLHYPNVFFTEEASLGISWAINHAFHYSSNGSGAVCFLDYLNWKSIRANGIQNAYWVPGAVDPTVFHLLENHPKNHNLAFLGTYDQTVVIEKERTRIDYIRAINANIPNALVAKGYYAFEANKIWNSTYVGIDVPIVDFCSFRLFQIIAAGAYCLTRQARVPSGIDYLLPNNLYSTYNNLDDLLDVWKSKSLDYFKNNSEFLTTTKSAREYVLKHNTFKERAKQLLQIAKLEPREESLFFTESNFYGKY